MTTISTELETMNAAASTGPRWLVTGATGMLGAEVVQLLRAAGEGVVGTGRTTMDITNAQAVHDVLAKTKPHIVINCAAYTAVDEAETHEDEAMAVNGDGPRLLAEACADEGVRLVHVSTDFVFSGTADTPYAEDDVPEPRTAYGRTKLAGEQAVLAALPRHGIVVRTAWLYGVHGQNFVKTMIRLEREKDTLKVVNDQRGQPTWARDVAEGLIALGRHHEASGIFHATGGGETTWCGFAREIFRLIGADPERVRPVSSASYRRPAPRPTYSALGHDRWKSVGMEPLPEWQVSLAKAFESQSR